MSYTGDFIKDLGILHDILADATAPKRAQWDTSLVRAKVDDLGDLVASTRERPVIQLTERQRRLLWEAITMVDLDTLNDNLARVHQEATGRFEMRPLEDLLDPNERYQRDWANMAQ